MNRPPGRPERRGLGGAFRGGLVAVGTAALLLGVPGLQGLPGASAAVGGAVGVPLDYVDHSYVSTRPPSEDKPQSKLWYLDGSWWALMAGAGSARIYIHELTADHTWRNTGTLVDSRTDSTGDALWSKRDGKLYVASRASGSNLQVNTFSYDPARRSWSATARATVSSGGGSESATIDQDSLGRLWVTYTRASRVWVAHTTDAAATAWTNGFLPAVGDTTLKGDDISALIAFGNSIGVLYSDQQSGGFHFAIHRDADPDTTWRSEDIDRFPNMADDHINLKQLVGDPQGRIFAAIKTSVDDLPGAAPGDPLVGVLTRTPRSDGGGTWSFAPAGSVADDFTRPLIMIDATNQELYFFATAPVTGGDVFYKKTPLSSISFPPGKGAPFIDLAPVVNNASGAKDPVTAASGLVIVAVAHGRHQYVHGEMALAGGGAGGDRTAPTATTSPIRGATGVPLNANVTAAFSEAVEGVSGVTFTLENAATGARVPAAVSYDASTHVATLDPGGELAGGTQYTARLTGGATGIRDPAGNGLSPNPMTWNFTTAAGHAPGPTVTVRQPADGATGVGLAAKVSVTFGETVEGVDATSFTLTDPSGASVPGALSRSGRRWIIDPDAKLAKDTRYTVALTAGIHDASGNPMDPVSWTFLTGPVPKVSSRSPGVNATGVSRTAMITATFNEPVQGVGTTTFTLRDGAGALVAAGTARSGTTNTWVLDPVATLAPGTSYTVSLGGGITDLAGNPLPPVSWRFTTRS